MASWIRGEAATEADALDAAAALLAEARLPAVAGLVADVDSIRAGIRFAAQIGAFLDPLARGHIYAELGPLAGSGTMETVPGEALARADLVLAFGEEAARSALLADLAASRPSTGTRAGSERQVICLGGAPPGGAVEAHPVGPEGLPAAIAMLRAVTNGRLGGEPPLPALAARLRAAAFPVLLYDPAEIGDLAVEMATGLAKDLSESTRCFALPLADAWQGRAITQIAGWSMACGPAAGFGRGRAEHDPWRFDLRRAAPSGEADTALWLAALPAPQPSWIGAIRTISLVAEAKGSESEIVIEVAQPGQGKAGSFWHERRNALVHYPATRPGVQPTVADILAALGPDILRRRAARC